MLLLFTSDEAVLSCLVLYSLAIIILSWIPISVCYDAYGQERRAWWTSHAAPRVTVWSAHTNWSLLHIWRTGGVWHELDGTVKTGRSIPPPTADWLSFPLTLCLWMNSISLGRDPTTHLQNCRSQQRQCWPFTGWCLWIWLICRSQNKRSHHRTPPCHASIGMT